MTALTERVESLMVARRRAIALRQTHLVETYERALRALGVVLT